jgi:hypothetical protein
MGDPNRQFLAISLMMRSADLDATRDLDRGGSVAPALEARATTRTNTPIALIDSPAAA